MQQQQQLHAYDVTTSKGCSRALSLLSLSGHVPFDLLKADYVDEWALLCAAARARGLSHQRGHSDGRKLCRTYIYIPMLCFDGFSRFFFLFFVLTVRDGFVKSLNHSIQR